jgi:hypothetical protein
MARTLLVVPTAAGAGLARALDADVLLTDSWPTVEARSQDRADHAAEPGPDMTKSIIESLAETLSIAATGYLSGENARVVGCVIGGLPTTDPSAATQLGDALSRHGLRLIAAVPHRPELAWLRVRDLIRGLNPQVLCEGDLSRRIKDVAVFAQGIPGGLRVLTDGRLVVVPGGRGASADLACDDHPGRQRFGVEQLDDLRMVPQHLPLVDVALVGDLPGVQIRRARDHGQPLDPRC